MSRNADQDEQVSGIEWLTPIEFPTRTGQNIDISLRKTTNAEDCYVRKPGGTDVMTTNANIEGVTIHSSSDFVSCRITIGPMDESLLGDWALCGKRADNNGEQDRCQLVRISWNNIANPATQWTTTNRPKFDYAVNYGGVLSPTVVGSGNRISCHIITPKGEDLVIESDSDYPHLKLVPTGSSTCSVAIGPIDASLLGDWTLYGKFRAVKRAVLNEVRLPMNLFLYDEENPYSQAYNVTVRDLIRRIVNLGSTLNVEVTSTGKVDSCQCKTPSGDTFDLDSHSYEGASFVNVAGSIACRLEIGPFTEELLGNWTIIGKFSNNNYFTELQQTFQLSEEDPRNPIIDADRTVTNLNEQRVDSYIGDSQRLIINTGSKIVAESCHISTPGGLQYAISEGFNVPGVEVIEENGVECGVIVHVLSKDAIGTWTLIARAARKGVPIERRLPFTINVRGTVLSYVD
ncbi:Endonuclease MutS2 [Operophtera brumata]|uniref:Endonuclease MutS2 n=1 Tax=Operophtera brumata TaxID=104452 RepID=A0A0L7LRS9_OPEBR|nr:Endonuclease MutS2 [Operophtera brumata]